MIILSGAVRLGAADAVDPGNKLFVNSCKINSETCS